ncbi:metallophosphoesterase family protein [Candidatus Bipolaricaulota bacterium]|nr:metallophosphoesterase family protein [Candidatus Bipolaricaulota bacterium]
MRKTAMRVLVLWVAAMAVVSVPAAGAEPWAIHLSWQNDPATTMTIMWRTDPEVDESVVNYGLTEDLGQRATGARHSYTYVREEIVWHTVELTDLIPNTTYYYRCGAPEYWSEVYSFTTAPAPDDSRATFKFALFGDTRGGYATTGEILRQLKEEGVRFILFTGDFTDGGSQYEYNLWFKAAGDVLAQIPFMPVHGNHEGMKNTYFDQFTLPGNEKWFSFDYAYLHFTCLLSLTEDYAIQQRAWLIKDLKSAIQPWKIVVAHHPAYSADKNHGCTQFVLDHWVDVLERHNVDLYVSGHAHNYERSWPVRDGRIEAGGVIYLVVGAAGAPLIESGRDWWTALSESTHHYAIVSARPSELRFTVRRVDGTVLDEFILRKP